MKKEAFDIVPAGPFSFALARDVIAGFPPLQRHEAASDATELRLALNLDGDHRPVGVTLGWNGKALVGETDGPREAVRAQVARMFSLDHDASEYPDVGRRAPEIGRVMALLPGLRPVCFTSPYACAAWAILSQRIRTSQARVLQERIAAEHGETVFGGGRAFPTPERLLEVGAVRGLAAVKLARLHGVARAALDGKLDARRLRALGDEAAPESLRALEGIGPFWSLGIYLRACGVVDFFPDEPLSLRALAAVGGTRERCAPFRMWICFLLRVAHGRGLRSAPKARPTARRALA